jgi:hypothetical protein
LPESAAMAVVVGPGGLRAGGRHGGGGNGRWGRRAADGTEATGVEEEGNTDGRDRARARARAGWGGGLASRSSLLCVCVMKERAGEGGRESVATFVWLGFRLRPPLLFMWLGLARQATCRYALHMAICRFPPRIIISTVSCKCLSGSHALFSK